MCLNFFNLFFFLAWGLLLVHIINSKYCACNYKSLLNDLHCKCKDKNIFNIRCGCIYEALTERVLYCIIPKILI